jgi:polyhydroxybutyrate depolymerase
VKSLIFLTVAFLTFVHSRPEAFAAPTQMSVNVNSVRREALVFAPAATNGRRIPVILAFHGHGGNPSGFARNARLQNAWPEALVVYPKGLRIATDVDRKGEKPGWQRRPGEVNNRDLKFVDAILAKLRAQYSVDDKHIFAVGFSNGAFFTYLLWAERPRMFAAFAPVAGRSELSGSLTVPKPAVQIGGRADQVVHLADVERAMTNVRRLNGCAETGEPCGPGCTRYSSSKNAPVIDWIHPGPHIYPPHATPVIIGFFKELANAK